MPKVHPEVLTKQQLAFIDAFMETGDHLEAYKRAGYSTKSEWRANARRLRQKDFVIREIKRRREMVEKQAVIDSLEVMDFFAKVMRGEVKDQFGLETSVADRIKAAQELAKRTVDIDNRLKGVADAKVEIALDWGIEEEKDE